MTAEQAFKRHYPGAYGGWFLVACNTERAKAVFGVWASGNTRLMDPDVTATVRTTAWRRACLAMGINPRTGAILGDAAKGG